MGAAPDLAGYLLPMRAHTLFFPAFPLVVAGCAGTSKPEDTGADPCPVVVVDPPALDFRELALGAPATDTVTLLNNCSGSTTALTVQASVDEDAFTVDPALSSIAPGELGTLTVTATVADYADSSGTLALVTSDPARPLVTIALSALADPDQDGDGSASVEAGGDDCDDLEATRNPSATEVCDPSDIDEDCDGVADDLDPSVDPSSGDTFAPDADGDGHGDSSATTFACEAPAGYTTDITDCDDANDQQPDAHGFCAAPYTTEFGGDMLVIEAGSFTMGGGRADPSDLFTDHEVTLTRTFWLAQHEVTQDEWAAWTSAPDLAPSYHTGGDLPVEKVTWEEAAMYANALSAAEGLTECYESDGSDMLAAWRADPYTCPGYRLPTEAEFEYAARAGENTTYAGSDTADDVAWHNGNAGDTTHETCTLDVNGFDLCDMSGNVWEWTNDWYDESYGGYGDGSADVDPPGPATGSTVVIRSGSFTNDESITRVVLRYEISPTYVNYNLGFRLARTSLSP